MDRKIEKFGVLSERANTLIELSEKQIVELANAADEHRTVIIVSHGLGTIKELCNEVLWLHEGKIMEIGNPAEVIAHYEEFMKQE